MANIAQTKMNANDGARRLCKKQLITHDRTGVVKGEKMTKDFTQNQAKGVILKCEKCNKRFNAHGIEEGSLCKGPAEGVAGPLDKNAINSPNTEVLCGGKLKSFDSRTHDRMMMEQDKKRG